MFLFCTIYFAIYCGHKFCIAHVSYPNCMSVCHFKASCYFKIYLKFISDIKSENLKICLDRSKNCLNERWGWAKGRNFWKYNSTCFYIYYCFTSICSVTHPTFHCQLFSSYLAINNLIEILNEERVSNNVKTFLYLKRITSRLYSWRWQMLSEENFGQFLYKLEPNTHYLV